MRKISGVLLALAASLALGSTTVAAKDDVVGGGGSEKMQNEGKGGNAKRCFFFFIIIIIIIKKLCVSRASCMRPSLGLERSAFPSLPLAPRLLKSRLSHRQLATAAPRKVAAVCEAHESKKRCGPVSTHLSL